MTRSILTALALFALNCLPSGCTTLGTTSGNTPQALIDLVDQVPDGKLVDVEPGSVRYNDLAGGFQHRDTGEPLFTFERQLVIIKHCDFRCMAKMDAENAPTWAAGGHKPAENAPTAVAKKR